MPAKDQYDEPIEAGGDITFVPIYRKQLIGGIEVGNGHGNITVEALKQITQHVVSEDKTNGGTNSLNEVFEFQCGAHQVSVKLGEACEL